MKKKSHLSALIQTTTSQQSQEKSKHCGLRKRMEAAERVVGDTPDQPTNDTHKTIQTPEKSPPKIQSETTPQNAVVRDTFSFPENDYRLIAKLRDRTPALKSRITKSEALRAGLYALDALGDQELAAVFRRLERVKAGRKAGS